MKRIFALLFLVSCLISSLLAQKDTTSIYFKGQATLGGNVLFDNPLRWQMGGLITPAVLGKFAISPNTSIDFEASLTANGSINFTSFKRDTITVDVKPYRLWLRFSGDNWEVRAGLQKINFGTAKMFRPLMWFDAMDVRDPLKLTDGVYGILGKYFFQNNANVWLWGLIGNNKAKGYEPWGSSQWKPELGGRFESPVGRGEMGLSTHFRTLEFVNLPSSRFQKFETSESRIGLDGKWDIGIGLWFESSVTYTDTQNNNFPLLFKVQDLWNVGADYTLPIGSGVGVTLEYFRYHAGNQFLLNGNGLNVLGTMLTYPISMLDNLSGMVFYLPDQHKWMNYLSWGRTYDNLNIYAIGYWNPANVQLVSAQSQSRNLFAGKGLQLMLNYNF